MIADAQRSGLDRRRPARPGRARRRRASDPHHRRSSLRRAVEQAVEAELAALPRAAIARASWRDFGAIILVERLDEAPPGRSARAGASRNRHRRSRSAAGRSATPARSSSAATRRKRSAIMSPARTTCCRRRAARAFPQVFGVLDFMKRTSTSSSTGASPRSVPPRWRSPSRGPRRASPLRRHQAQRETRPCHRGDEGSSGLAGRGALDRGDAGRRVDRPQQPRSSTSARSPSSIFSSATASRWRR